MYPLNRRLPVVNNHFRSLQVFSCVGTLLFVLTSGCTGEEKLETPTEPRTASPLLVPVVKSPRGERLELKLNVGDRFKIVKRIEQTLVQQIPNAPHPDSAVLELFLTIEIEEIRGNMRRLGMHYDRVRSHRNIANQIRDYDSAQSQPALQTEELIYQGLKNNSFSFWIGTGTGKIEPVGFEAFLDRCVQFIPAAHRAAFKSQLAGNAWNDGGIANFTEDGLALFPADNLPQREDGLFFEGESWRTERHLQQPIPMLTRNEFKIAKIEPTTLQLGIAGRINPVLRNPRDPTANHGMVVKIRGGRTIGSCTINRHTGIPIHSDVTRHLEMLVQLDNGTEFRQSKTVVTTIQAVSMSE